MIKPWKLIKRKQIYKDTFLTLNANMYETSSGNILDSVTVLSIPEWINVIALTDDDKIILVRQYRHAANIVNTGIPAGSVEKSDKSIEEAIRRELLEETGYEAGKLVLLNTAYPNPTRQDNTVSSFFAYDLIKKSVTQNTANEELEIIVEDFIIFAKSAYEQSNTMQSLFVASLSFAIYFILHSQEERFKSLRGRILSELFLIDPQKDLQ